LERLFMRPLILARSYLSDWRKVSRLTLAILLVAAIAVSFVYRDSIDEARLRSWLENLPWWESVGTYLLIHLIGSLLFVPRFVLGGVAGALFGAMWGTVLGLVGGTLGGLAGFWLVRYLSADSVKLPDVPMIEKWISKAEAQGWRLVLTVRLIPVLPHFMVNYVFGLSRVSTVGYVIGTVLGMLPTAIIFANLGATSRDLLEGSGSYAVLAAWGIGLIFVSWIVPKLLRRIFPDL
jgi:uncharacterized membrane protein YdjX (TVP38/TMEM64 family)